MRISDWSSDVCSSDLGGVPEDSRITTRYDEADFAQALMGVLHETGHAMYERARPKAWRYQPVGEARGMALHESQSLIVEMQACRAREFFQWAAPVLRAAFPGGGPGREAGHLRHRRSSERSVCAGESRHGSTQGAPDTTN